MTSSEVEDSDAMLDVASASHEGKGDSPFSDPVFQQLAHINGLINRMKIEDIIAQMKQLKLDVNGNKDVLRKRLKSYYKDQKLKQAHMTEIAMCNSCPYKFLCVIDFEATCDSSNGAYYPHEIIEFPAILIDTEKCAIVDTFHEYVRPSVNPLLSDFCTALTGISQTVVDKADTFQGVLTRFLKWKELHHGDIRSFVVVTDGPWDMGRFLVLQCKATGIPYPDFAKKWINVRKSYSNFYKTMRLPLAGMLEFLGMSFEGQPHSGLDDAKNIARVVLQMLKDGASLHINERITWNSLTHSGKQLGETVVSVNRKGKSSRDKKKTVCNNPSEKEGTNKCVNEAMELMSRIEIDPSVAGSEAVLYNQKQSSKRQLL